MATELREPEARPLPSTGANARPLGAYALIMGTFGALHLLATLRRRTSSIGLTDALLLTLASYQFGRTLAQDVVTAPFRTPFVERKLVEEDGKETVKEVPAGSGLRLALGQLLTCPDCAALWGAGLQTWGWVVAPGLTRPLVWILAASGGAHLLQQAQQLGGDRDLE